MESLKLLKFWRKSVRAENGVVADVISAIDYVSNNHRFPPAPESDDYYSDDDNDSFFELELNANDQSGKLIESPRDVFHNGKPESPISTLKPGPKFKLYVVGFTKSSTGTTGNNVENGQSKLFANKSNGDSPKHSVNNGQSKRFAHKNNGEETPVLSRDNSLRSKLLRESFDESSKRSDTLRSKLLKPLYSIASKRYNVPSPVVSPMLSPVSSPRRKTSSGLKNVFAKSKSSISTTPSPVNRRDDCLLHDGIQGAILHCNRSYNSPAQARDVELQK